MLVISQPQSMPEANIRRNVGVVLVSDVVVVLASADVRPQHHSSVGFSRCHGNAIVVLTFANIRL